MDSLLSGNNKSLLVAGVAAVAAVGGLFYLLNGSQV
jgi:hypothetical protein